MTSDKPEALMSRLDSSYWIAAFLFLLLSVLYYHWTWSHILAGFGGDNAIYLLTAQYYSPYSETTDAAQYFHQNSIYPPLFPLLLALFGGAESLLIAHIITTTCLLASFVFLYLWLERKSGNRPQAVLFTAVIALLPGIYMQSLSVHSESLYMCLVFVSLYCISKAEQGKSSQFIWWAAIVIGLASLSRSVGVSLIAALMAYAFLNNIEKKWYVSLAAITPYVAWKLFSAGSGQSYLGVLMQRYSQNPTTTLVDQLGTELNALWLGWQSLFSSSHSYSVLPGVLIILSLAAVILRIREKKLDGYYILFYFLIILVWPFPGEAQRFLVVIVPIMMAQIYFMLSAIQVNKIRRFKKQLLSAVFLSVIVISAIPDMLFTIKRFSTTPPDSKQEYHRHPGWYQSGLQESVKTVSFYASVANTLQNSDSLISPAGCVYAIKPSIIAFFTQRKSVAPPNSKLNKKEFQTELNTMACQYFYFMGFGNANFPIPFYPVNIIGKDSIDVLTVTYLDDNDQSSAIAYLGRLKNTFD